MSRTRRTFFFYGTLLDADIRAFVMGRLAPATVEPATLAGWRRVTAPGMTYPMILPEPGSLVDGALARDLSPGAVSRLVTYEGPNYRIAPVEVALPDGGNVPAEVFVPVGGRAGTSRAWDLESWQRRYKRRFLARMRAEGPIAPC